MGQSISNATESARETTAGPLALPEYRCSGHNYVTINLFCEDLSLCRRGHFFYRDGVGMNVFCFAERAHAEQFLARFGGEFIDPKDRPKWPGSGKRS